MRDRIDRRALGALRFVDPEGAAVRRSLIVSSDRLGFVRNRSGALVLTRAPGLDALADAFVHPATLPAAATYSLTVRDAEGRFVPRAFSISLPRAASPRDSDGRFPVGSLFAEEEVLLYFAPQVAVGGSAATVRVRVSGNGDRPLRGALVRVTRTSDGVVLGRGVAWDVGPDAAVTEALVVIPRLPRLVLGAAGTPVFASETAVTVAAAALAGDGPHDPDTIEQTWGATNGAVVSTSQVALSLSTGAQRSASLTIPL